MASRHAVFSSLLPLPLFSCPVLRLIQLIAHGIDHSHRHVAMIQKPLNPPIIAARSFQLLHGVSFPQRVHAHVLRHSKGPGSAFNICPYSLTCSVLPRPCRAWKGPFRPSLGPYSLHQWLGQIHPPPLSRFCLSHPELTPQLDGRYRQHITNPQTGMNSNPAGQPISRGERRKNVLHFTLHQILCCQIILRSPSNRTT